MGIDVQPGAAGFGTDLPGSTAVAQPASDPAFATAAPNTAVTVTLAAVVGQRHRLTMLMVSYSAAPAGGRLQISDAGAGVLDVDITTAGATSVPLPPGGIRGSVNQPMVITLGAGGAAVVGKVSFAKLTA